MGSQTFKVIFYEDVEIRDEIKAKAEKKLQCVLVPLHVILVILASPIAPDWTEIGEIKTGRSKTRKRKVKGSLQVNTTLSEEKKRVHVGS